MVLNIDENPLQSNTVNTDTKGITQTVHINGIKQVLIGHLPSVRTGHPAAQFLNKVKSVFELSGPYRPPWMGC